MKVVFALILMTYSYSAMAQVGWSCQIGESLFSFELFESERLKVTEARTSITKEPQIRIYSLDLEQTWSSPASSTVSFRYLDKNDPVYGEQIVLFAAVLGEWSSFYYAYTDADDPEGYIYEYNFYFDSDCDLGEQKLELTNILQKLSQVKK